MTLTELTEGELNQRLAELVGHDEWMILKRGYYYRPNGNGYTSSLSEAWKLPKSKAKKHEMYVDRKDVDYCEKVFIEQAPIPNYCQSLDAVALVEAGLTDGDCQLYIGHLAKVTDAEFYPFAGTEPLWNHFKIYTASARQRTIALIQCLESK